MDGERMQKVSLVLTALLLAAAACVAGANGPTPCDSFERGVPPHWRASREGALAASPLHSKHGSQSLRWDWQAGDELETRCRLGDIRREGGYGGSYSKATFGVWLCNEKASDGRLRFQFRTGRTTTAHFDFPLNFTGWRRAHLRYSWRPQFNGKVSPDTDRIVIVAPGEGAGGPVFLDLVVYNGLMDYRLQHVPTAEPWLRAAPDAARFPLPQSVAPEDVAGIDRIGGFFDRSLAGAPEVGDVRMAALQERVDALGVVRDDAGIRGLPVVAPRSLEFYDGVEGVQLPTGVAELMLDLARAWHGNASAAQRERIEAWYMLLADHLYDQGMRPGAGFPWNWYNGRALANATFLMRKALQRHGRLAREAAYFESNYGCGEIYDDATLNPDMDHFRIDTRYHLFGALMQVEPTEQARALRAYARRLSMDILHEGPNGFKPDGAAWHHGMHYHAYANGALFVTSEIVRALAGTPFHVSADALQRLKRVALAMRFYSNRLDVPLSLQGRHPHTRQHFSPELLLNLALAGSPDGARDVDPDLAAAYLRLAPERAGDALFAEGGIRPEGDPQGNMALNYAGVMAHRRDGWLATVKGYGAYFPRGEIYADNNRFGRYLGHGSLDILSSGDPVTRAGSGCVEDGWDYNRLDGATTVYLPEERLRAVSNGTESLKSEEPFVGGLSHRGRNGVFVMPIHGHERHDASFRAKKSYFFFDDRIICLGSNIENSDATHPTQTTLFQKALPSRSTPIIVNGMALSDFPHEACLMDFRANWIIDPQGTGYYLPEGQSVCGARQRQHHRDQRDRRVTEGDFAVCWICHGEAPKDGGYEYAVLVRTTPARMAEFAKAMESPALAPYQVAQKDADAHIVRDRATRTWTAVFFKAQRVKGAAPVRRVSRACLVMAEDLADGGCVVSVCDPDLNLRKKGAHGLVSVPRILQVVLNGAWRLRGVTGNARVAASDGKSTTLEIVCRDGLTATMDFASAP